MGWYASRCVFCELFINNEYKGIYVLMERIKQDVNRVNVSSMSPADSAGDALTGGYILKIDWVSSSGWTSPYPPVQPNTLNNTIFMQYVYPKDYDITIPQMNYIQSYVDSMEDALASPGFANPVTGFRKYADESSFIDYYLINEISKNVDGYRLSTYFNKQRNSLGGKIHMGPVWDYNLAWNNADYCNAQNYTGWALQITNYCQADIPFWFGRMLQDTNYTNNMRCRYEHLRSTLLDTTSLFSYIDSMAFYLDEAQQRHYETWPILGVYVWPNPQPLPTTYAGEIESLKIWIKNRLNWMDTFLPGHCYHTGTESLSSTSPEPDVYPNPSGGTFRITIPSFTNQADIAISNLTGQTIYSTHLVPKTPSGNSELDIRALSKGIYILTVRMNNQTWFKKLIVQ